MEKSNDMDRFENILEEALRSNGYLFPKNDRQFQNLMPSLDRDIPLPKELEEPDFVFSTIPYKASFNIHPLSNIEGERNWAIAAREGHQISPDVFEQMRKDKKDGLDSEHDSSK